MLVQLVGIGAGESIDQDEHVERGAQKEIQSHGVMHAGGDHQAGRPRRIDRVTKLLDLASKVVDQAGGAGDANHLRLMKVRHRPRPYSLSGAWKSPSTAAGSPYQAGNIRVLRRPTCAAGGTVTRALPIEDSESVGLT